jgi:hypothetical protein
MSNQNFGFCDLTYARIENTTTKKTSPAINTGPIASPNGE